MITINIYYRGKNGNAKKFAQEMISSKTVDLIKAEKGNLRYEYFFPMDNDEVILLIDSWKDEESLDIHHSSPMMKTISDMREKYDLHMTVEKYVSNNTTDEAKDEKFIRK